MADLIVRPYGDRFALQLRHHDCCGPTVYETIARVTEAEAREIVKAGAPYWLYGDPLKTVDH